MPAVGTTDVEDGLLLRRGDETIALAHFEILTATKTGDELPTDAMLHIARHVVIHILETTLHHRTLVGAEHLAMLISILGVALVYGGEHHTASIGILANEPTQTLLAKGAMVDETHFVVVYLLTEDFFLGFYFLFLFHDCKGM